VFFIKFSYLSKKKKEERMKKTKVLSKLERSTLMDKVSWR
jgi:hypothetical protein